MSSSSLKEYLKRYESSNAEEEKRKKKKKKKTKKGVVVVDEDPVWQKPFEIEEEEEEESEPQVDEDIEVKRMKRLELLKSRRPYGAISEDGSGWISVADISPPRRRNDTPSPGHPVLDSDMSPPRKRHNTNKPVLDSDMSPPRKRPHKPSDIDMSPPRKRFDPDLSPPRKRHPRKTGLVSGKDVKAEISKAKQEDWLRFQSMDPSISGRNAQGVRRDKITGERLSKEQIELLEKKDEKPKEIQLEWGKGLAQKREAEARLEELQLEKAKPFARTRDDPDLDGMLKGRLRWGDPMAHLVKKKHSELVLPDIGDNDKMKESGFVVPQQVPNHSWLKRGLDAAPNRYDIRPGRHWDGVDRSNGFEKQMFNRQNEKQATEREAYLWSVADM